MNSNSRARATRLLLMTLIALAVLTLVWSVTGCGSGGSAVSTLASGRSAATGRAVCTLTWPPRQPTGKLIPIESNSIQVVIQNTGGTVASQLLVRPYPSGSGSQSATVSFGSLLDGPYTVVATAYPNADGTGAAQASGGVALTVTGGNTTNFTLTMQTTVTQITVAAANASVTLPASLQLGQTLQLVAMATDAAGSTVITPLVWTATNPYSGAASTTVSVLSNGLVTALAPGAVTITATDPESGESGSATVNVLAVLPTAYTAVDIGLPFGRAFNDVTAINDSGQVVGSYYLANGVNYQAFVYSPQSGFATLSGLPTAATYSEAADLNDSGQIVGNYTTGSVGTSESYGFVYAGGVATIIAFPGATINHSFATAINASGQIAGCGYSSSGDFDDFLYSGGILSDLGDPPGAIGDSPSSINSAGQIVGSGEVVNHYGQEITAVGFLYAHGSMQTIYPPTNVTGIQPSAVNDSGEIVGNLIYPGTPASISRTSTIAFTRIGGTYQKLDEMGTTALSQSAATAVNNSGFVVGTATTGVLQTASVFGYVYYNGTMENLNDITTGIPAGISILSPVSISNNGLILAYAFDNALGANGMLHALVLTPASSTRAKPATIAPSSTRGVLVSRIPAGVLARLQGRSFKRPQPGAARIGGTDPLLR